MRARCSRNGKADPGVIRANTLRPGVVDTPMLDSQDMVVDGGVSNV
jgi:NAD(P)-dependent dehydrogenase (short-subunit alcohol dehydrogenase family)